MRKRARKGFTIVELVIVIGVIGILTAILIPTFTNLTKQAQGASQKSFLKLRRSGRAAFMFETLFVFSKTKEDPIHFSQTQPVSPDKYRQLKRT